MLLLAGDDDVEEQYGGNERSASGEKTARQSAAGQDSQYGRGDGGQGAEQEDDRCALAEQRGLRVGLRHSQLLVKVGDEPGGCRACPVLEV